DDNDMDMHLERLLRMHQKLDQARPRILEINPAHPLIRSLAERATQPGASDALADAAQLLLDQARVVEGEPPADPVAFAQRMARSPGAAPRPPAPAAPAGRPRRGCDRAPGAAGAPPAAPCAFAPRMARTMQTAL